MIKLDRTRKEIKPPAVLTDKGGKGDAETKLAIKYFTARKKPAEKFTYEVYRSDEVKAALKELSYGKCAYCESKEAGSDYDIEHFRPKGKVTGPEVAKDQKGYYWLAADWENLFLSCQHCNQSRTQEFWDGTEKNSGKKNQFPLSDEKKRVKSWKDWMIKKNDEDNARLLLNPEKDNPADHICFKEVEATLPGTGETRIIPLVDAVVTNNVASEIGETSIRVFGLNRKLLVEVRLIHYNSIKDRMRLIDTLIRTFDQSEGFWPEKLKQEKSNEIAEELRKLQKLGEDNTIPYSAMIKTFISTYLEKSNPHKYTSPQ